MRLIDAELLLKELSELATQDTESLVAEDMLQLIESQPTVTTMSVDDLLEELMSDLKTGVEE